MNKLPEAMKVFNNEYRAYQMFRKRRWGTSKQVCCSFCTSNDIHRHGKSGHNRRYRCLSCYRTFTDLTDTIFARSKIPLWKWLFTLYEFSQPKSISASTLSKKIAVSHLSAWRMLHKIRELLREEASPHTLQGTIEIDEAWTTKSIIQGLVEQDGQVAIEIIENTQELTLRKQIEDKVVAGSTIHTDGRFGYRSIQLKYHHRYVNHSEHFVHPLTRVHTNTIEAVWSHLKRLLGTIYHGVTRKYLKNYLAEFTYRYNYRKLPNLFSHLFSLSLSPRYCLI